MPDAGRVWAALSQAHAQSGLVPFLLDGLADGTERPWDKQEFRDPDDTTGLEHLDAAALLRERWQGPALTGTKVEAVKEGFSVNARVSPHGYVLDEVGKLRGPVAAPEGLEVHQALSLFFR